MIWAYYLFDDLSWRNHYEYITPKTYKYLGLLRCAFSSCHSVKATKILYTTLIRSQLPYCSQLWNPHLIKDTVILERIQRQATKFILRDYNCDCKTRLLQLDYIIFFIKALISSFQYTSPCIYPLAPTIPDLPLLTNLFIPALTTTILETCTLTDYQNKLPVIDLNQSSFTNIYNDTLGTTSHLTPHACTNVQTVTI